MHPTPPPPVRNGAAADLDLDVDLDVEGLSVILIQDFTEICFLNPSAVHMTKPLSK